MVGSPSLGSQATNLSGDGTSSNSGIKVKVLLNGSIKPEDFVEVKSEKVSGLYKIESVQHIGDYEGTTLGSLTSLVNLQIILSNLIH